jgi:anti-anti-sigma factor
MVAAGSSFFNPPDQPRGSGAGHDPDIVVRLRGDQDISTDDALCRTLAHAIALDDAALVIDLSEVEFMGLSTLAVVVRARELLRTWSRSLTVRSPSPSTLRLIDICGLDDLLGPKEARSSRAKALGSWVAVPVTERSGGQPGPSAPVPGRTPACVGRTSVVRAPDLSADGLAETA